MKIYINEYDEIKAIYETDDLSLMEKDINREYVFGDMSDFMILNHKYVELEEGYSIAPTIDYSLLLERDYRIRFEKSEKEISFLKAENETLKESQDIQDRTIVENDMRMMDLEWILEDLVMASNEKIKINLVEVFNMKLGRSATYFNQLKQMIERENYDSKEEMERILNKYKSGRNPRITQEEYDQLFDLLYPPVYDIPTAIPEV